MQLADLMRKLSLVIKGSLIIFIIAVLQAPIICGSQPRPGSQPTRPLRVNQGPWEPSFCREALIYDGEPKTHLLVPAVFLLQTLKGHFLPEAVRILCNSSHSNQEGLVV